MYRYVIKRVLFLIPTILGVTFIIFFVLGLSPVNPGRMFLGPTAKQESIDALNHDLGYDLPIAERYVNYLKDIVTEGDFGMSYFSGRPVFDEIWPRFLVTIRMSLLILVISVCVGVPVGIYSAVRQYSLWDNVPTMMAFFLAAVPSFVRGMVLMYFFALKINIFPSFGLSGLKSYILPVSAVAISEAAAYLRFTKSSMLEAIRQDYVRTARGKGVPERTVIWMHAIRKALLTVITCVGMRFGVLLAGMVTTERLFSIPGIGSLIVDSISKKDEPVIIAASILIASAFTMLMLLVDIAYAYVDPRIRAKYSRLER